MKNVFNRVGSTRVILMGLLFAMVGFTFALASNRNIDTVEGGVASSRGVGSASVRFLNNSVLVGSGKSAVASYDLGDVTLGSFVIRYARATGGAGVLKYASTSALINSKSAPVLSLLSNGVLSNAGTNLVGVNATAFPLSFTLSATDQSVGSTRTSSALFRLSLEASSKFKVAIASLGEAVQFQSFTDGVSTVNGNGAATVTASNVKLNGTAVESLESVGLSLAADGTLAGVPLQAGVLTFTATAIDGKGRSAQSRDLSTTGQTVTLVITGNTEISTQAVCQTLSLKIGTGTSSDKNNDSLTYIGQVNLGSRLVSDFNGTPIRLTIGGFVTPNNINTPATLQNGKTTVPPKGAFPKIVASVTQKGVVKITVTGINLNGVSSSSASTQDLAVGVIIGDSIAAAQVLTCSAKSGKESVVASYKFGSSATKGGAFILTSVRGQDAAINAPAADAWNVQFLALPQVGASFSGTDHVAVNIGNNYSTLVGAKEIKNKVSADKNSGKTTGLVLALKLDGVKGTGSLTTSHLLQAETGIAEAGVSANPSTFPLSISAQQSGKVLFSGSNATSITSVKSSWGSLQK